MAGVGRHHGTFAVLFLDLEASKTVHDELGHAAGDHVLVALAARLRDAIRAGDIAARMGGDEFVVLLDAVATRKAALAIAERILRDLAAPYVIGPDQRVLAASIGVALGRDGFRTADDLVAAADAAMYKAKRRGGGRCASHKRAEHRSRGADRGFSPPPGGPTPARRAR